MKANTVYDVFLALSDEEKKRLVVLVNGYKPKAEIVFKKNPQRINFTKTDAMDFLLKTVFTSKK